MVSYYCLFHGRKLYICDISALIFSIKFPSYYLMFFEKYLGVMTLKSEFAFRDMRETEGLILMHTFSGVQVRLKALSQRFK